MQPAVNRDDTHIFYRLMSLSKDVLISRPLIQLEAAPMQLKLSQAALAGLMGVSVRTVQDWEQDRLQPSGPAKALLRTAEQHPEVFTQLG